MTSRTISTATALAVAGALLLGLDGLSSPTQAAPSIRNAPATDLDVQARGTTYRARPFGTSIRAGTPEFYRVKVPRSGNYHVTMTGFVNYDTSPATLQCFVVDLQKILVDDYSGYYLISSSDSEASFDFGLNEAIDVDLKKAREILLSCQSSVDIDVLKPITVGFQRSGGFKNLDTDRYTPPDPDPLGELGGRG
jgi:hypothetical protein